METSSILNLYSNILHSASHIEDENMSFLWGEQPDVMNSRINFLSKFDLEPERSVMMSVVHGTEVAIIDESKLGLGMYEQQDALKVDALITNKPKINLCLLTADCLPISFYDPIKNIIAISHAGWQGIDKKIIGVVIDKMIENFQINPADLCVEIGPHIKKDSYQFDNLVQLNDPNWRSYLERITLEKYSIDLTAYALNQLTAKGVSKNNISISNIDTAKDDQYFSHYRSANQGAPEGRFLSFITMLQ